MSLTTVDAWLGVDKLQHFTLCALVTVIVFVGSRAADSRIKDTTCLIVAGTISLLAGLTKELGDHLGWWSGRLSLRDIGADVAGNAFALALIVLALVLIKRNPETVARGRLLSIKPGSSSGDQQA